MGGGLDLFSSTETGSDAGALSVLEVTKRAKRLVESGFGGRVWVRGEIVGFKAYQSGHWYFALRDSQAQVRCVMWRSDNRRVPGPPEDGMQVFVDARPTVWEERGEFRLTVKQLVPTDADGLWQLRLEKARAALERDGLLDPARKSELPKYPSRIGVVTSPDGAAFRDVLSVLERRWPAAEVLLVPTRVQGDTAESELCAALRLLDRVPNVDVAIVGRGGGSREDLWVFNSERVARAVSAVSVPTISAVGHETDVTLTDLVADARAPTPSAAAEAAVPEAESVRLSLDALAQRLAGALGSYAELGRERLARTADRLTLVTLTGLERRAARLERLGGKLEALSPLRVLARGYSVARDHAGRVLKRTSDFERVGEFELTVTDGRVSAQVKHDEEKDS